MISEKVSIKASPEHVFEAIRNQRNGKHRKLQSFEDGVAVINEDLEGVPVFGNVHCVWEEREKPHERIDFKMLSSTKFKESYGAYILTPSEGGKATTLEMQIHMDPGLNIPFAAEITKASTSKDSKARLQTIKNAAEQLAKL